MTRELVITIDILGYAMLLMSILSMQVKRMQYMVILQSIANALVVVQYAMRGELSASGVCALGALETLLLFFFNKKGWRIPLWFTLSFITAGLGVSTLMIVINGFNGITDILPMIAVVLFNVAMVQSHSSISRILMLINSSIWLTLNIISFDQSTVIAYSVLTAMAVVGIVRLDRKEWCAFFHRLYAKLEKNETKDEENV